MSQTPKESRDTFYKWAYIPLIAPALVTFALSLLTGRVVILVTGIEVSIGAAILIVAIIFVVMSISFYLGMGYFILSIASLVIKTKMPWHFRAISTMAFPIAWLANKIVDCRTQQLYRTWDKQDMESKP